MLEEMFDKCWIKILPHLRLDNEAEDRGIDLDESEQKSLKKSYVEEQDDLKKSFRTIKVDEDADDLFKVKSKSQEEKVCWFLKSCVSIRSSFMS